MTYRPNETVPKAHFSLKSVSYIPYIPFKSNRNFNTHTHTHTHTHTVTRL